MFILTLNAYLGIKSSKNEFCEGYCYSLVCYLMTLSIAEIM
jgi:hypothetical protein